MYHFALNRACAVGPIHNLASLEVDQLFLQPYVHCVGGEKAPARSLHPIVVPHVASQANKTGAGGGLDVFQFPKDFCLVVLSVYSSPVAAEDGPSRVDAHAEADLPVQDPASLWSRPIRVCFAPSDTIFYGFKVCR